MRLNLFAAAAAASLVVGGVASAAETRSVEAMPSQAVVTKAPAAYGAASVSRTSRATANESELVGRRGLLPIIIGAIAAIIAIYFATKSKG